MPKPRTKSKAAETWTPTKHRQEVSAMLAEPVVDDPWLDLRAFLKRRRPPSSDVLAFWEWELQADYWDNAHLPDILRRGDEDFPKLLWQKIQTCRPLLDLVALRRGGDDLHALVMLLRAFFWRECFDRFASPSEPALTKEQARRFWGARHRALRSAYAKLQATPDPILTRQEQEQLSAIILPAIDKAARFAETAPRPGYTLRVQRFGVTPDTEILVPPTSDAHWPTKGQHRNTNTAAFTHNLETTILHGLLTPLRAGPAK